MDELESLKRKKLEELKKYQEQSFNNQSKEEYKLKQQIEQLESIVKQVFTKDALSRYGNVKIAHPEKAVQLLVVLGQMIRQGRVDKIDDAALKSILKELTPKKKEFKIKKV